MKKFALLLLLISSGLTTFGQQPLGFSIHNACNYYGDTLSNDPIYTFASTKEATDIVKRITDAVGLAPNFLVMAANVDNAEAVIDSATGKRYILYSQNFISTIETNTGTDWTGISILAHEIGHHLNGHTLVRGKRTQQEMYTDELEADKFSGFVCYKLGATLAQAQAAINSFPSDKPSATHPGKSLRLEAIAVGWSNAKSDAAPPVTAETKPPMTPPVNPGNSNPEPAPVSNDKCAQEKTGDYTFTNQTSKRLIVKIYRMSDYSPVATNVSLAPGESKTFYDLPATVYGYNIDEEAANTEYHASGPGYPQLYSASGEIRVEQCKNKTFEIK